MQGIASIAADFRDEYELAERTTRLRREYYGLESELHAAEERKRSAKLGADVEKDRLNNVEGTYRKLQGKARAPEDFVFWLR